jgi:hypothetical protein
MPKVWRAALKGAGLAAALVWPGIGAAQPLEDPEANVVEELVIQAREPGPAWWKVSDADTTVYILGVGEDPLPPGVSFDRRFLDRRMKGANSLIVGTRVGLRGGFGDIPALLRLRKQMRSKAPMEASLPEPLRTRFAAARTRIGAPAGKYDAWKPMLAGLQLLNDAQKTHGGAPVTPAALKAAKREKVKVVSPATYRAVPVLEAAMASLTPQMHEQCLDLALRDAETPPARSQAAARAWARGDVAGALTEPRAFEKCLLLLGGGADLWRRVTRDNAAAIAAALQKPGHSVAVVSLRALVAEGGVLQELERRGLEVEGGG